jgi:O-antigen ligase
MMSSGFMKTLYEPVSQSLEDGSDYSGEHFLRGRGLQWFLYAESYLSGGPIRWMLGRGGSVIESVDSDDDSYILSPNEPHNDYIRILHAYGLVGLVLYLSILTQFFRRAIHHLHSADRFARSLARVVLPVLAAVLVLSLTTEPMRYPTAVWYLFALGSALFTVEVKSGAPLKESVTP